ncbi:CGNR zinc finger domain-containing protein [Streptomyces sp. NPDC051018]|uniref:CGNR zinc finger domain-containing protein n=1 Tax=Streptomyces sp. NPDC051018 TaxID=3365639 RepID=UPI0037941A41
MATDERTRLEPRVPPEAAMIVNLLNSRPHGAGGMFPDQLDNPETAGALLSSFGPPEATAPTAPTTPVAERVEALRGLRTALLGMVWPQSASEADARLAELDAYASTIPLRQVFSDPGEVGLRQVGGDPAVGGITRAVAVLMAADKWSRIRICDNPSCHHAFYDATRSRTQRWHSYEMCGNKANVAAYRARRKAES